MSKHFLSAVFLSCLLSAASWARADVPPPEATACAGKQVGDSCSDPPNGTCQNLTCGKLDYANWNRDASSIPPSTQYPCVRCAAKGSSTDPDASSPSPDAGKPEKDDGGGCDCSLGSSGSAERRWLALGMAALVGALLLRRRQTR